MDRRLTYGKIHELKLEHCAKMISNQKKKRLRTKIYHISYYIKDKLELFIIHTLRITDLTLRYYWYVCKFL
jgi:hypothetical protein